MKRKKPKVQISPAGVHKLVKVDTYHVTMLVHIEDLEDEDNDADAKRRDLLADLPRSVPFATSHVEVEHHYTRHVPSHQVPVSLYGATRPAKASR